MSRSLSRVSLFYKITGKHRNLNFHAVCDGSRVFNLIHFKVPLTCTSGSLFNAMCTAGSHSIRFATGVSGRTFTSAFSSSRLRLSVFSGVSVLAGSAKPPSSSASSPFCESELKSESESSLDSAAELFSLSANSVFRCQCFKLPPPSAVVCFWSPLTTRSLWPYLQIRTSGRMHLTHKIKIIIYHVFLGKKSNIYTIFFLTPPPPPPPRIYSIAAKLIYPVFAIRKKNK